MPDTAAEEIPSEPFRIRSLALPVYIPTLLFAIGQGAVIPIIALRATDLGSSVAFAAFVVGLRGIGTMVFDVPAGILISRLGERQAMVIASAALLLVAVGATVVTSPVGYAAIVFLMGCSWAIWLLARLSYVSEHAPVEMRGRALSLIGGTNRLGHFAGPAIGGFIAVAVGLEYVFWMHALFAVVAAVLMFAYLRGGDGVAAAEGSLYGRLATVVVDHRRIFLTAGVASICLQIMRNSRQAVIPLWGEAIGLDAAAIGLVFTLSAAFDAVLFYPVGMVMDRFGRKWVGVPSMVVLGIALMLVPLTDSFMTLVAVGVLAGLGNGLGAGINMTLGADFSPPGARGEFLGVWRLVGDIGTASGPLVVSVLAGAITLGFASVATGGIGFVGAGILLFLVPEPLRRSRGRTPARARDG